MASVNEKMHSCVEQSEYGWVPVLFHSTVFLPFGPLTQCHRWNTASLFPLATKAAASSQNTQHASLSTCFNTTSGCFLSSACSCNFHSLSFLSFTMYFLVFLFIYFLFTTFSFSLLSLLSFSLSGFLFSPSLLRLNLFNFFSWSSIYLAHFPPFPFIGCIFLFFTSHPLLTTHFSCFNPFVLLSITALFLSFSFCLLLFSSSTIDIFFFLWHS